MPNIVDILQNIATVKEKMAGLITESDDMRLDYMCHDCLEIFDDLLEDRAEIIKGCHNKVMEANWEKQVEENKKESELDYEQNNG